MSNLAHRSGGGWRGPRDGDRNRDVLVCFAVKEEVGFRVTRERWNGGCTVLVTGMGRRNAAESIRAELASDEYRLVLTCGFAGGLNPMLTLGTIVFEEDAEANLTDALIRLGAVPATFYCTKRVAVTAQEKAGLRESTGADAVEMESSVIRTICRAKQIPSATIRVILDTAREDLPLDFNALMTPADRINYVKVIGTILCKPHKVLPLWKFQRNSAAAADKLDELLSGLLSTRR